MILRDATSQDAAGVAALERDLFGVDAWPLPVVVGELAGADREAVVAVEGDTLLGYACTARGGEVVDLLRIAVHPGRRREGLASRLLAAVRDRAAGAGAERMLLEVSAANDGARAFYAREGFAEIGRRPRYYKDGTDAAVMQLRLGGRE